jgi:hypothetical protein
LPIGFGLDVPSLILSFYYYDNYYLLNLFSCLVGAGSASYWAASATKAFYTGTSALSSTSDVDTTTATAYACTAELDIAICQ